MKKHQRMYVDLNAFGGNFIKDSKTGKNPKWVSDPVAYAESRVKLALDNGYHGVIGRNLCGVPQYYDMPCWINDLNGAQLEATKLLINKCRENGLLSGIYLGYGRQVGAYDSITPFAQPSEILNVYGLVMLLHPDIVGLDAASKRSEDWDAYSRIIQIERFARTKHNMQIFVEAYRDDWGRIPTISRYRFKAGIWHQNQPAPRAETIVMVCQPDCNEDQIRQLAVNNYSLLPIDDWSTEVVSEIIKQEGGE